MSDQKPKPKTVELVKSDYQPTKAELEEEFQVPEGTTFESLTQVMVQPVDVRWIDKPRKRR